MRTTVDLPDDIHTLACELAHQQHKTMSEVLTEFIRRGISSQGRPGSCSIRLTDHKRGPTSYR